MRSTLRTHHPPARLRKCVGAAVVAQVLAASCVPPTNVDRGPCQAGDCLDGFRCCNGECIRDRDQCLGACAENVSGAGADRYLPFVPGSVWVYEVRAAATGQIDDYKHLRLGAEEELAPFAEGSAHRLCREDRSVDDVVQRGSIRWQRDTGAGASWVRNLRFDTTGVVRDELCLPPSVRLDESNWHRCVGAEFDSTWTSRTVDDPVGCTGGPSACPTTDAEIFEHWETRSIDAPVEVPGHGEQRALRVTRTLYLADATEISDFWFVRGVGKVSEWVPTDEDERLIYYDVPGVGSGGENPFRTIAECTPEWLPGDPP